MGRRPAGAVVGRPASSILAFGHTMILWIESQTIIVISLLVFGFCYALTIAIMGAALVISRRPIAKRLKGISPVS